MAYGIMDSLKMQRRMLNFWESDDGAGFASAIAEVTMFRNTRVNCPRFWLTAVEDEDQTQLAATLAHRMRVATTFWTARDMVALVQGASETRIHGKIVTEDLPQTRGFVLFETPAYFDLSSDETPTDYLVNVTGFSWHQSSNDDGDVGVDVIIYSDKRDRQDGLLRGVRAAHNYSPWGHTPDLLVVGSFFLPYNSDDYLDDVFSRFVMTWWHLIGLPLASSSTVTAPKAMHKALAKLSLEKKVSVVTLRSRPPRKIADAFDENGNRREFSHRFIVHGFWRNQFYPSLNTHKPVYINDYVKGPEDKPLIVRTKVYAWRR